MSKSLVHSLEGYVHAIFQDVRWTYRSAREWERDKNRSLHELAIRGERFFTIDLPAIRKHFEQCLEKGQHTPSGSYLGSYVSKGVQVPAFLRDLYLQVFSKDGKLRDVPNVFAIADLRQLLETLGKLKETCKQEYVDEEVKNFSIVEKELRFPSLDWNSDSLLASGRSYRSQSFEDLYFPQSEQLQCDLGCESDQPGERITLRTLQSVCDIISTQLGDLHNEESTELPQHGTGRVSNLDRRTSKFDFRVWPNKLDHVFPYDRYARANTYAQADLEYTREGTLNYEHPSKLIAVPKTMSGPRLIASEPNYHQWIQQLVRNQIENRLSRSVLRNCITFGDQSANRILALRASRSGAFATVDLKSASDRLSCWTVERALRGNIPLLERIHASRTRVMVNAVNKQCFERIILKKCFTQGSACTFPVQTVLYAMFAIASVLLAKDKLRLTARSIEAASREVRIFGDDIIVPDYALRKLLEVLQLLQLKVNLTKTFSKGNFRESCGLDAYDGVDVTPARIKRFSSNPSHEVAASMLESANNLFVRGMWNTAMWLQSYLNRYDFVVLPVRHGEAEDQPLLHDSGGLVSFCGYSDSHLRRRWNSRLHRYEVRCHVAISKSRMVPTQSAYDIEQYLFNEARKPKRSNDRLKHLRPKTGTSLGIVDKQSSVMSSRWRASNYSNEFSDELRVVGRSRA